jgi:dienelactone hydrolase
VLVFSPGGGTFRADYTALYEDLASHGYVVVAVSHPGITLMSLTDGRIGREWSGWRPPPELSMSLERDSLRKSAEFFARTRDAYSAGDIRFVLDQLRALDLGAADGRFTGRLDFARVGAFGHSTGGAVVVAAALTEPRIRAVIVYDVILPRLLLGEELDVPLMLFGTDDTRYPPGWHALQTETFTHLRPRGYEVTLRGGGHNSFSDRALLTPSRYPYRLTAAQATDAIRLYTRAFFDTHVRGRPSALLEAGTSHPDIALKIHPARDG